MSRNERPGVYTSYEVNSTVRGFGGGGAVGLAAAAGTGTPNRVVAVSDYTTALTAFGSGSMAELAYAAVSKTAAGNGLRVRSPLLLPSQAMPAQITMEGAICHGVYPLAICTCWLRQCHLCQSH